MVDSVSFHSASAPNAFDAAGARVAILMRTRNRPVLLARAIGSVLLQDHADWHLLLVNDGGDPGPVDTMLEQHETGLAGRVTVLHRPAGAAAPAAAADHALVLADRVGRFGFVAVHDDDESWHPTFLRRTVSWLLAPGHEVFAAVGTHWEVVQEQADRDGIVEMSRQRTGAPDPVLRLEALLGAERIPPVSVLLRRAALPASELFGGQTEQSLLLRVARESGDIGVLPEVLAAHHRRVADSLPDDRNRSDDAGADGEAQAILCRNAGLRALLRADPSALSVLDALRAHAEAQNRRADAERALILANLDRNGLWGHARHEDLQARLVRIERMLSRHEAGPPPATPPVRPLWKRAARRLAGPLIDRVRRHSA